MKELLDQITGIEHGFKHITDAGNTILSDPSQQPMQLARSFIVSEQPYQIRMLGTYLLGILAADNPEAMYLLEEVISKDENWRVQEMLAKAFDDNCRMVGYKNALPKIKYWLSHDSTNVKRAVTEGLRIWTGRDYFRENPAVAVTLISSNKNTTSIYLRKSIGNSLRDILKKHKEIVDAEVLQWDLNDKGLVFIRKLIYK
ncbi:DNA alkylation repair protein [Flavobacterium rakeshii]|uniref:DNA alkylation repair protein n=1 Tax=Flavobacterium rakeshii TaxID=1038845 RepID=UPI002E7B4B75|nr:DNA alkylation repair protein [Flavobacterium rakeshii]MEE1897003.1 DNA alkylation repair protein [Flavobacterium rakeshii]